MKKRRYDFIIHFGLLGWNINFLIIDRKNERWVIKSNKIKDELNKGNGFIDTKPKNYFYCNFTPNYDNSSASTKSFGFTETHR